MAVGRVAAWRRERRARAATVWWGRRGRRARLGSRPCAAALCLVVLLLLLLALPCAGAHSKQCACGTSVKVLMLNVTDLPIDRTFVDSLEAGLEAALWSRNFTAADGVNVTIIRKNATMETSGAVVEEAMKSDRDILLLACAMGDMTSVFSLPVMEEYDLVSFAPLAGSSLLREWHPNMYFVHAAPATELLALLGYALAHLRVLRLGFMYIDGVSFGDREYEQAKDVMSGIGLALSGVFSVENSMTGAADEEVFDAAWEVFADTQPQAVIVFGSPISDTAKFVTRMLTDNRTAGAYLLAPSVLQELVLRVWRDAVAGGVRFVPGQVVTTGTNPLAKDTNYKAIRRFQDVMRDYLQKRSDAKSGVFQRFPYDDSEGEMMVAGWIAGEVLSQALSAREWVKDRQSFRASLYSQRRYVVDDIVIGDYGGECGDRLVFLGATCFCNEGGRTVYVKTFVEGFVAENVINSMFTLKSGECGGSFASLHATLNGVAAVMRDRPEEQVAMREFTTGVEAAKLYDEYNYNTVTFVCMNMDTSWATDALLSEMGARRVHFVSGVVTDAMLDVEAVTFIDPLQLEPRLHRFRRHVIHLSPTLEQELFVLAEYLGKKGGGAHAVIRSAEAAAMADVLRLSLATFGVSLLSATLLAGGDALAKHLPVEGDVFAVGLSAGDAGAIARHVASHGGVRVFVLFSEFALLHAEFVAAFRGGAGAERVAFATSLPHWNDGNSTSDIGKEFAIKLRNATQRTPLSLMGFTTMRLLYAVFPRMHHVGTELLADFIYRNVAVTVGDMAYGPFADGKACPVAEGGAGCGVNYGATRISVWPLARALDPAVPVLSPAVTPSMKYSDPAAGRLRAWQLAGIIGGGVAAVLLLAGVLLYFFRDSRDNANAPRERLRPVTLVFTDIESSTALWAACPEVMPDAVATHHRLIRSLIAKYRCYEVKTIGDSFMIACKSAFAAVQLARELQWVLLQHDWGTGALDDAYHRFEEGRAEADGEYVPPTARLDAAVYRQYWNGLRVRVGVHTGLCDIRYDEVTKGYDYYGDTANMAARTESVGNGGQVLLTRAAYMALSRAEREHVCVTALGAVALRGVPKPVEMYQLDAVPGRTFAALRLDREAPDLDDGTASDFSSSHSRSASLCDNGLCVESVIRTALSAYSASERAQVLSRMCERWNVREGRVLRDATADEHVARAVERLSVRLGEVLERSASAHGARSGLSQGTLDRRTLGSSASLSRDSTSVASSAVRGDHGDEWAASTASSRASVTVEARMPSQLELLRR